MTVKELTERLGFCVIHRAETAGKTLVKQPYCCDLLSVAMAKAPEGAAWVTVMSNLNTLAVASLTEAACVIIAEGTTIEESIAAKAKEQDITLLSTDLPAFEAALCIYHEIA